MRSGVTALTDLCRGELEDGRSFDRRLIPRLESVMDAADEVRQFTDGECVVPYVSGDDFCGNVG